MILLLACLLVCHVSAYNRQDSMKIVSLLQEAKSLKQKPKSWMLWFGKKFIGVPYVAGTLDRTKEEQLVINTRQLDCTTYVEMVTALTLCAQKGQTSFAQYCEHLIHVRYIGGKVEYTRRQHYFTVWINDNEKEGIVTDIHPNPPFTAVQKVDVNWMSTHSSNYKMLTAHPERKAGIKAMERSITGKSYRYIPKTRFRITNSSGRRFTTATSLSSSPARKDLTPLTSDWRRGMQTVCICSMPAAYIIG